MNRYKVVKTFNFEMEIEAESKEEASNKFDAVWDTNDPSEVFDYEHIISNITLLNNK